MTDDEKHLRHATLDWTGKLVFQGGNTQGGPTIVLDGDGEAGPSPVMALLLAAGACAGADVVSILEKKRVELASCRVEVTGRRNPDYPRRYNHLRLTFRLKGVGLTEINAARAVQLSVEKYCSVLLTLDPAMPIETAIVIE
jgi:putative redox protein